MSGQDASGLHIGDIVLDHTPHLDGDVEGLLDHGVPVFYVREDLSERGISDERVIGGVTGITRSELPALFDEFEHVWRGSPRASLLLDVRWGVHTAAEKPGSHAPDW